MLYEETVDPPVDQCQSILSLNRIMAPRIEPMRVLTKMTRLHVLLAMLEAVVLCAVTVGAYKLRFTDDFPVYSHDVPCSNTALLQPLTDPSTMLFTIGDRSFYYLVMVAPLLVMLLMEVVQFCCQSHIYKDVGKFQLRFVMLARRVVRFSGAFLLGLMICSIFVDLTKLLSGQPRPFFLTKLRETCCASLYSFCPAIHSERDIYMSFPSHRATVATFAAVFSSSYVHFVLKDIPAGKFLRTKLVALLMLVPLVVCTERLMANRNHLIDLGVGIVFGTIVSLYMSLGVIRCFSEQYFIVEPLDAPGGLNSSLDSITPLPPTPPPANIRSLIPRLYTDRIGNHNVPFSYGVVNENLSSQQQRREPILAFERPRQNSLLYTHSN